MWEVEYDEHDINSTVNNVKFNMAKWVTVIGSNNIMRKQSENERQLGFHNEIYSEAAN